MSEPSPHKSFEELSAEPDFYMDVRRANARIAALGRDPRRVFEGTFNVPDGVSVRQFEQMTQSAGQQWIAHQDKAGWRLLTKLKLFGPKPAYDPTAQVPILGYHEWTLRAIFAPTKAPKSFGKIEIPAGLVKTDDPEQAVTLKDAQRALR